MAKENIQELANRLRQKGLTCSKLRKMINDKKSDARDFEKVGFQKLAKNEIESARAIKSLKDKVCRKL